MRKTLSMAMAIAIAGASPAAAAKAAHKASPKMPTEQSNPVHGPNLLTRCFTNNPSCSGYARFGNERAWSIRILYNQGRGGEKNFTADAGQVVSEPVRYNDVYQYAPGHVVVPTNAQSYWIPVD